MPITVRRAAEFTVALRREQTMMLFTAEGERAWAGKAWDPRYPSPERRDGPGAVFTTGHAGHNTTWVMVDHRPGCVRYARVTEGVTAGTVTVEVVADSDVDADADADADGQATRVRVTYDLTALSAAGERWLAEFDAGYSTKSRPGRTTSPAPSAGADGRERRSLREHSISRRAPANTPDDPRREVSSGPDGLPSDAG